MTLSFPVHGFPGIGGVEKGACPGVFNLCLSRPWLIPNAASLHLAATKSFNGKPKATASDGKPHFTRMPRSRLRLAVKQRCAHRARILQTTRTVRILFPRVSAKSEFSRIQLPLEGSGRMEA